VPATVISTQPPKALAIGLAVASVVLALGLIGSDGLWWDKLRIWLTVVALLGFQLAFLWRSTIEISASEILISGTLRRTKRVQRADVAGLRWRRGYVSIVDRGARTLARLDALRWGSTWTRVVDALSEAVP
jgi:hypothetical protein